MDYKVIEIEADELQPSVELRFSVASERAAGTGLIRFDIPIPESEKVRSKALASVTKTLKQMKEEKLIQFFATEKSFSQSSTEAQFLLNKYPSVFLCGLTDNENADFFYVKL